MLGCKQSLPEASVIGSNGGESKPQWRCHVFVTVSNYDTQGRQESEPTGMFCGTESEAKSPSVHESEGAS